MLIHTARFVIRDFDESDRAEFVGYQRDARYRHLYDLPDDGGQRAGELFDLFAAWKRELPRRNVQVGIFDRVSGRLCGCCGLRQSDVTAGTATFGIELTPDDWGRYRLAVEVAAALIDYGFSELALYRIIGDTASGNRLVEKLARLFGATIVARRDGPDWMVARGWVEVDWALPRTAWAGLRKKRNRANASCDTSNPSQEANSVLD